MKMDVKESEKTVVAKPVASRPTCSNYRSFSELLVGAINASPSNTCSETAVTAIRPKTVRFKPTASHAPNRVLSSQAEFSGAAVPYSSDAIMKSDTKSTVLYKPLAKLVSKATVSLLANLGNSTISHQQALAQVEARAQPINNQVKSNLRSDIGSNLHQNFPPRREKPIESSKMPSENLEDDQKTLPPSTSADRPSYDGYNWRKYGQKQVKGSEYPRSYYKCTHPNCPVKKKVERSLDGQIAEIVYKGEHSHIKPQPPKRNTPGAQGHGVVSDGAALDTNNTLRSGQLYERNEGSEGRLEYQNEVGLSAHSTYSGKAPMSYDPVAAGAFNTVAATPDNSCGLSGDCEEGSKVLEVEDDEPKSKRRRNENQANEAGISGEGVQEPRIVVQNSTDTEIVGDGFRWRKYGQKVVKGNPYPRSYYRCTSLKCNVRKHVERASDDPRAFITTYEGTHNHDRPNRSTNPVASEPDLQVATSKDKL